MTVYTGTVTSGSGNYANQNLLELIKDKLVLEGWTVLRYNTGIEPRELIVQGDGYSGTEEIYIGFRSYQNVGNDYYNLSVSTFIGYVSGNTYAAQPGYVENSLCAHNTTIDYWLNITPQRVLMALKVGTPVYETAYVGKFFPYASPSQFPYPVCCIGTLTGQPATRFSDTTHTMGFRGTRTNCLMRDVAGASIQPATWPYNSTVIANATDASYAGQQRETGTYYFLNPIQLMKLNSDIYGELEGVYHISGFNNIVENTISVSGRDFVVIQDVSRNGFNDYLAVEV